MIEIEKGLKEDEISARFILDCNEAGRTTWANTYADNNAYYNGAQIEEATASAMEADELPVITINEIRPAIELLIAMLCANSPRFNAMPFETSDNMVATFVSHLLEYIWKNSDGNGQIERAVKDLEIGGLFCIQAYYDPEDDYGKGEVKFTVVDPECLYIDPYSKTTDAKDATRIAVSNMLSEAQVRYMFPKVNISDLEAGLNNDTYVTKRSQENQILKVTSTKGNFYRMIDRYDKIKVSRYHVIDSETDYEKVFDSKSFEEFKTQTAIIITQAGLRSGFVYDTYQVSNFEMIAQKYGNIYHYMQDPISGEMVIMSGVDVQNPQATQQLEFVTVDDLIKEGVLIVNEVKVPRVKRVYTIGREIIYNEIMPIEELPFSIAMIGDNRNPYPIGDISLVKGLQDQLNVITAIIIKYNVNITNVKAFIPEGGVDEKKLKEQWGKPGAQFFKYDPELGGVPVIIQLTQMSSALYKQREDIIAQIQRILGSYAMMDGDTSQSPNTKGGTILLDEYGQRRIAIKRKRIERAIDRLAKIIMQFVPYAYKDKKIIRILRPHRTPETIVLNDRVKDGEAIKIVNDVSAQRYDISYVSGSMMPTNLTGQFDMMERMYTMGALKDPKAMIELLPLDNIDEILQREDMIKQYEQYINDLEGQIKKLSGDLQTSNRAEVQSRKRTEVEKFKSDLKGMQSKLQAQALVAKDKLTQDKPKGSSAKK